MYGYAKNIILFLITIFCTVYSSLLYATSITIDKQTLKLWEKAQELYYAKEYDNSIEIFDDLIEKFPTLVEFQELRAEAHIRSIQSKLWYTKAKLLVEQRRFNHAHEALKKSQMVSPFEAGLYRLSSIIAEGSKKDTIVQNLDKKSAQIFKANMENAQAKLDAGDNEGALRLYAQALELAPKATNAVEGYAESQKRFLAGQNQDKIITLVKDARQFTKSNRLVEALATYKAILHFDPVNREALENIEPIQKKLDEEKNAEQKRSLVEQYKNTGDKFLNQKQFDDALEQYELGREILPKFTDWKKLIKKVEHEKELDRQKQEREIKKAIDKNYNTGLAFLANEKFQDAVAVFQKVIDDAKKINLVSIIEPAELLLNRATLSLKIQEEEEISKESPYYDLIQSLKTLALQKIELRDYLSAKKHIEQILDLFPHNRFANQYIALIQIKENPSRASSIVNSFISEIKVAIKIKDFVATKRLFNIVLFIEPDNTDVLALKLESEKTNTVLNSLDKTNVANTENLWKEALKAQQSNDIKATIQLAKKILAVDPQHLNARRLLTRLEGGSLVLTARVEVPSKAQQAYAEGILRYNNGDIALALKSFQTAIQIFPTYTKALLAADKCKKYLNL